MSRLDLGRSAISARRIEPSHRSACAGQARGIVELREQRGARNWRGAMGEMLAAVRDRKDSVAPARRTNRISRVIEIDESMIESEETIVEELEIEDVIEDEPVERPAVDEGWELAASRSPESLGASGRQLRHAIHRVVVAGLLMAFAACSSLVDDPCASGYMLKGGTCVERVTGLDGGVDSPRDAPDSMTPDSTMADAGTPDSTSPDAGSPDAGSPDAGSPDAGPPDAGSPDAGSPDASSPDAGSPDATPPDASTPDSSVVDAGVDAVPPDAPVCLAPSQTCNGTCTDVMTAADDCGSCGHVCASGICVAGQCAGELAGHIIAIGHDYQQRNAAMARVIGNAAALAATADLGISHVVGTATIASRNGTTAALTSALASMGRSSHAVTLPAVGAPLTGIDVLVIDAQTGDGAAAEALGTAWKPAIDALLARHGVVIVVEGAAGVSHRFATGAGLFTVATPVDTTGSPAFVMAAGDAVTQQVVSPYLADTTSVVFPAVVGAIATPSGTVVMHLTR